jgi:hypothetical protein
VHASHLGHCMPHIWYITCLTSGPLHTYIHTSHLVHLILTSGPLYGSHLVHYMSRIWVTSFLHTLHLVHHIVTSGKIHVSHLVPYMSHIWYNTCFISGKTHVLPHVSYQLNCLPAYTTPGTLYVSYLVHNMSDIWSTSCLTFGTLHVSHLVHCMLNIKFTDCLASSPLHALHALLLHGELHASHLADF